MPYLSQAKLESMGFKKLGQNVLISDKASIYDSDRIEIGDHSRIDDFCVISGKVVIGRNVHIAIFCNLAGGSEGISMEDFSGLAYRCDIFSQSEDYSGHSLTNPTVPSMYKKEIKKAVKISRHCIIGANSVVFPGVTISEGTSVGAMSMVTESTEPWAIYCGIPATKRKMRNRNVLKLEMQYLTGQIE